MKKSVIFGGLCLMLILLSCSESTSPASKTGLYSVEAHYTKKEVRLEMRDGTLLHTSIYSPKDTSRSYPILLKRTPYSCRPYGEDQFPEKIAPNKYMMKEGYIVVYQDVRGRWMSEGQFDNMRAFIRDKKDSTQVDESSDTYDSIEWLVNNVPNNNGKVGIWGISYPGFYSTYASLDAHPALKAASPQACIGDFYFDDFHHNGAYLLSYFRATSVFGTPKDQPVDTAWYSLPDLGTEDQYQFFLDAGPLKNLDKFFQYERLDDPANRNPEVIEDFFWSELRNHPDYDSVWQSKGIIQHLDRVPPHVATMIVGGWFDAEDLYGPLETYKGIEASADGRYNTLVFGPWDHGAWAREVERNAVGNYYFGDSISDFFQREIESKFFSHFLKGEGDANSGLPEAMVYDSGLKQWSSYNQWPPPNVKDKKLHLNPDGRLSEVKEKNSYQSFVSDLKRPVPYSEDIKSVFTPRKYMTDDQRFAARRPDVLVYETTVLEEDLTLAGSLEAELWVSTTGTDADWIVKVVDVHPPEGEEHQELQSHLKMDNYHLMVRSEVMRGKYRNSFSEPQPFVPNQKTKVKIKLQDVYHTFKKGHKLQVQVQSTWFPLIDLNPQTFVPNIFLAEESDFKTQTHRVYSDSSLRMNVLNK